MHSWFHRLGIFCHIIATCVIKRVICNYLGLHVFSYDFLQLLYACNIYNASTFVELYTLCKSCFLLFVHCALLLGVLKIASAF